MIYSIANSIIVLFPIIILIGEGKKVLDYGFWDKIRFWIPMVLCAILGYLINIVFFLQINYTTPLTNTVSGTAKTCVQTLLSAFIFETKLTFMVKNKNLKKNISISQFLIH